MDQPAAGRHLPVPLSNAPGAQEPAASRSALAAIMAALPPELDGTARLAIALNTLNLMALQKHSPLLAAYLAYDHAAEQRRTALAERSAQRYDAFLTAAAAAAPDVLARLRAAHAMRPGTSSRIDARCTSCRTDSGRPAPWPCEPFLRFDRALRPELTLPMGVVDALRAAGEYRNHPTAANRARMQQLLAAETEGATEK